MPLHAVVTPESAGSRGHYNIQAVARRTGVPAPTIRAWERRYGLPRPSRSEGRQRLYSEDDVRVIEWLRARIAEGLSVARAAALWHAVIAMPPADKPGGGKPPGALAAALLDALLRHEVAAADATIAHAL